jgi:hypothetical protein
MVKVPCRTAQWDQPTQENWLFPITHNGTNPHIYGQGEQPIHPELMFKSACG